MVCSAYTHINVHICICTHLVFTLCRHWMVWYMSLSWLYVIKWGNTYMHIYAILRLDWHGHVHSEVDNAKALRDCGVATGSANFTQVKCLYDKYMLCIYVVHDERENCLYCTFKTMCHLSRLATQSWWVITNCVACTQIGYCNNTVGSFTCGCKTGYFQRANSSTFLKFTCTSE